MDINGKRAIFVVGVTRPYRIIFYCAVAIIPILFGISILRDAAESWDYASARLSELVGNGFFWVTIFVLAAAILTVESRKVSFFDDHFCDRRYFVINRCYSYSEIDNLGEDRFDGYLLVNLKNGKTVLIPEFVFQVPQEGQMIGYEIREFLQSRSAGNSGPGLSY